MKTLTEAFEHMAQAYEHSESPSRTLALVDGAKNLGSADYPVIQMLDGTICEHLECTWNTPGTILLCKNCFIDAT